MALTSNGSLRKDDNSVPVGWNYKNIATATTTVVKSSPGFLHSITFNTPLGSGTVSLYDNASAGSGTSVGVVTQPATLLGGPVTLFYDVQLLNGLTVVTTGTQDITVSYI